MYCKNELCMKQHTSKKESPKVNEQPTTTTLNLTLVRTHAPSVLLTSALARAIAHASHIFVPSAAFRCQQRKSLRFVRLRRSEKKKKERRGRKEGTDCEQCPFSSMAAASRRLKLVGGMLVSRLVRPSTESLKKTPTASWLPLAAGAISRNL